MRVAAGVGCTPTVRGRYSGSWGVMLVALCIALLTVLSIASPSKAQTDGTDTTPPGPVTDFAVKAGNVQASLSWTNPTDDDFSSVRVVRSEGGPVADNPDGEVTANYATVYEGSGTDYTDTGLTNGINYYYTAFTRDVAGNWSPGVEVNTIPKAKTSFRCGAYIGGISTTYNVRLYVDVNLANLDNYCHDVLGKNVTLWRSTNGGTTWTKDGTAAYGDPYNVGDERYYLRTKPLTQNLMLQWRFAGDSEYMPAEPSTLRVGVKAYLSKPVTPTTVKKDTAFTTYGYLKPYHSGYTRLDFYRYNQRQHKWAFYKTVYAKNTNYNGYTKYIRRYKLPYAGDYYVKAFHKDASHVASWSSKRYFTVKR